MPRRTRDRNEPVVALSFFDSEGVDSPDLEGHTKPGESRYSKRGPAPIPGVVRPTGVFKKTTPAAHPEVTPHVRKVTDPVAGSKRHTKAQIEHYKKLMKTHFGNTLDILDVHASWPGYATFERIEEYIKKVKVDYLNKIWEQKANHKTKIEEIHSKRVDIAGWDFESIHERVSSFATKNGVDNRLTLKTPWSHEGHKPYANVVLAWLFAAKKQLMYTLTVYLKKEKMGDGEAAKFVHDSEAGSAARTKFKEFKAKLTKRAARDPPFEDHKTMEEQYVKLHPHHAS